MTELQEFGHITFVESPRAVNIRVRILDSGLRVTVPMHASREQAIRFILREKEAILSKQLKMKKTHHSVKISEDLPFKTQGFTVYLKRADRKDVFFSRQEDKLDIFLPQHANLEDKVIQEVCWKGIVYFMRKDAKKILPEKTQYWADEYGFTYSSVKIQTSKSRWGSCSRSGNINLSLFLMMLPMHLIDYVILHELCHTREMNHSDKFWQLMDKVTDNKSKRYRSEMKKYHMPE